jgi:mycothiol synthase
MDGAGTGASTLDASPPPHGRYTLRDARAGDAPLIDAIWAESQDADGDPMRPSGGWWSLAGWATASRILEEGGAAIGVAAIEYGSGDGAAEARLALLPPRRLGRAPEELVGATIELARTAGAPRVRLYAPSTASWATRPAWERGFRLARTQHVMLRPGDAPPARARAVEGVRIRALREGEEPELLAALNRAWAGTWNYRALTPEALAADLAGREAGFLVAVEADDDGRIAGTVHALFDPAEANPDGGPYAWISNLTTAPEWRGRGLGRALLAAGLDYLRERGAGSVALGVDGGDPAPMTLYRSSGFETLGEVEIWEGDLTGPATP